MVGKTTKETSVLECGPPFYVSTQIQRPLRAPSNGMKAVVHVSGRINSAQCGHAERRRDAEGNAQYLGINPRDPE